MQNTFISKFWLNIEAASGCLGVVSRCVIRLTPQRLIINS